MKSRGPKLKRKGSRTSRLVNDIPLRLPCGPLCWLLFNPLVHPVQPAPTPPCLPTTLLLTNSPPPSPPVQRLVHPHRAPHAPSASPECACPQTSECARGLGVLERVGALPPPPPPPPPPPLPPSRAPPSPTALNVPHLCARTLQQRPPAARRRKAPWRWTRSKGGPVQQGAGRANTETQNNKGEQQPQHVVSTTGNRRRRGPHRRSCPGPRLSLGDSSP